jgi:hypothetical protein
MISASHETRRRTRDLSDEGIDDTFVSDRSDVTQHVRLDFAIATREALMLAQVFRLRPHARRPGAAVVA